MNISKHAKKRSQPRCISPDIMDIIFKYGEIYNAQGGAYKLFFGKKECSLAISELKKMIQKIERARGGTLVISEDVIITTYRQS